MDTTTPIDGPDPGEPFAVRPVPDLAGVTVVDADGQHAGTIYGALADATSGLIRYLDVALEGTDRHILVPLGHTRITRSLTGVTTELRAARRGDLRNIPSYEPHQRKIDGAYERDLLKAHGRLFRGERYYAHPAYDHDGLYAGEHPIIRGVELPETTGTLQRLEEVPGYQVAAGEPDIRGWPLVDKEGVRAGVIQDLLFDPDAEKVRYTLVQPSTDTALIPVPIGFQRVEVSERIVRAPTLTRADIEAIPHYFPGHFTRAEEERLLEILEGRLDHGRHFDRPDFYGR
jgi:sporulation protein YlmC with PRC-barrel domain